MNTLDTIAIEGSTGHIHVIYDTTPIHGMHPVVLLVDTFYNKLYHFKPKKDMSALELEAIKPYSDIMSFLVEFETMSINSDLSTFYTKVKGSANKATRLTSFLLQRYVARMYGRTPTV